MSGGEGVVGVSVVKCRYCGRPVYDPLSRLLREGAKCRRERELGRRRPVRAPAAPTVGQWALPGL